jgi:phage shock protein A
MSLQQSLNAEFPNTATFAAAVASGVQQEVNAAVAPLRNEVEALINEIAELRAQIQLLQVGP